MVDTGTPLGMEWEPENTCCKRKFAQCHQWEENKSKGACHRPKRVRATGLPRSMLVWAWDVRVRLVDGSFVKMSVNMNMTIKQMKNHLFEASGMSPSGLALLFRGVVLADFQTCGDAGLMPNSVLHQVRTVGLRPKTPTW